MSGARARRRVKRTPIAFDMPRPVPQQKQLEAACTVSCYEASRILGVRQLQGVSQTPSSEFIASVFDFSRADLLIHIAKTQGLAEELFGRSLDQRSTPSAIIQEAAGGYTVGWYDGEAHTLYFHKRLEEAATDFVLRFWNILH